MSDHYLLISSDCHAGPESGHYRDYMDPEILDAYDEARGAGQAARAAMRSGPGRDKFREQWIADTGDGGIHSVPDAHKRDALLDDDGVAAEVIFPDADVLGLGGVDSSPFGSGLGSSGSSDGAQVMAGAGRTTVGWPTSAPTAPTGVPGWRAFRSSTTWKRPSKRSGGRPSTGSRAAS